MTLTDRIERICKLHADCLTIASRLAEIDLAYMQGSDPDVPEVTGLLKRLEARQAATLRHTAIAHHEASQLTVVAQVGGGDKDEEYP